MIINILEILLANGTLIPSHLFLALCKIKKPVQVMNSNEKSIIKRYCILHRKIIPVSSISIVIKYEKLNLPSFSSVKSKEKKSIKSNVQKALKEQTFGEF